MISHLPELAAAGISSFKIEGRAKSAYYAAVTANAYRCALDEWQAGGCSSGYTPSPWIVEELNKVSHRPYSTGFYLGGRGGQHTVGGGYVRDYEVMGVVTGSQCGRITASQRNKLFAGDRVELLEPGRPRSFASSISCAMARATPLRAPLTPPCPIPLPVIIRLRPARSSAGPASDEAQCFRYTPCLAAVKCRLCESQHAKAEVNRLLKAGIGSRFTKGFQKCHAFHRLPLTGNRLLRVIPIRAFGMLSPQDALPYLFLHRAPDRYKWKRSLPYHSSWKHSR